MSSVSYSATFSVDAPARAQLTLHDPNAIFVIYPVPAQSGNTYHLAAGVEYGVNVTYYAGVRSWSDGSTIASNFGPTEIFRFALLPPHPGDANGDGSVNVNDLLAVIAGWGSCPAPPAACPGDVAPSPNGDGVINVLDLLAAISNWG